MNAVRATKRRLILLGAVAAMTAATAGLWFVREARVKQQMQRDLAQGMAAYHEGRYEDALAPLSRYVGRRRDEAEVLLAFADTRRKVSPDDGTTSHLRHALAVAQLALDVDRDSLEGKLLVMEIASELGYPTEADAAAAEVLAADPQNLDAHWLRLEFAELTGRQEERVTRARDLAANLPDSFLAQQIACSHLLGAGVSHEDLSSFVEERRAALAGRAGSEILAAMLEEHAALQATSSDVVSAHQSRAVEHVLKAAEIAPVEPAEATALLTYLDRNPGIADPSLANDLLHAYMADPVIADEILTYAAMRAWQRENIALAEEIVAARPDTADLGDETIGWLSLVLPDDGKYRDELANRDTDAARAWRRVLEAADDLMANKISPAREAVRPLLQSKVPGISDVAAYVDAVALRAAGEESLAVERLEKLAADDSAWVRARVVLRDIALEQGDHRRALELIRTDQLPSSALLLLETAVALDEEGYDWPPSELSGRVLADQALGGAREDPVLLALHGRAELAAGNAPRAIEVADELLALRAETGGGHVLTFAARLQRVDEARAEALRSLYGPAELDPLQALALELRDGSLDPAEARRRAEALTAEADEATRLRADLMVAAYIDRTGDSATAAAEYGRLCEQHPTDPHVQLAALRSRSLWDSPALVGQTVGRLRAATGEDAISWRVFGQRLALQTDPSEAAAANALIELGAALHVAERDVLALQLCAEASTRMGDFDRAAGYALRAASAAPRGLSIALDAVEALVRAGRAEEAKATLLEATGIPSGEADQRVRRGVLLVRYGFVAEAAEDWRWLGQFGDPDSRALAARMLAQSGDSAAASAIVAELQALPEPSELAVSRLAEALEALGRRDEALDLLRTAGGEDADGGRDARIAQFLGRHARAEADLLALEEFVRSTDEGDAWAAAVRAYMGRGQLDSARRVLAEARSRVGGESEALEALIEPLRQEREDDPNTYLLVARASLAASDADWANELAAQLDSVLEGGRSLDDLIEYLDDFVQSRPEITVGWLLQLHARAAAGDERGAAATAFAMLRALPTDPAAARAAVDLFRRLQLADEGLLAARAYAALLGTPTLESATAVAEFALAGGGAAEAWDAIEPWRDRLESDFQRELYIRAALGVGRVGEASAMVWGDPASAGREWLLAGIGMAPLIEDVEARRGWLETATSRATASPDDAVRLALATAWYQHGVRGPDRPGLERATELARSSAADRETEGLLRRVEAASYAALDRPGDAEASYRRCLELRPNDANVLNNLAFLLLTSGGDAKEALALAERAVSIVRSHGGQDAGIADFVDTLGLAQLRVGQPELALASFEESLRWKPMYEHARLGRAEALYELGRSEESRAALETLVSYDESMEGRVVSLRNRLAADPP